MRVLVASSSAPDRGSGISAYARTLSEALSLAGKEVHFLSPPPADDAWLRDFGIRHVRCGQSEDQVECARGLIEYIGKERFFGVINNDNSVLQSVSPALRCPVLAVGHMAYSAIGRLACYQHKWVDYVVAIASDMQRVFTGRYGVPVSKCPVVHNGLRDPGPPLGGARLDNGDLNVVFAGGFSANKGGPRIVRALDERNGLTEGTHLHWFGAVPRAIRERFHVRPWVTFYGRVSREDYLARLSTCDVFVLPSRSEGCPMALLEAMSFGVVPIVSDGVGAMRWLVTSGRNGFVCRLDRWAGQMRECLAVLKGRRGLLAEMKAEARASFVRDYTIEQVEKRLVRLIEAPTVDRSRVPQRIPVLRWHRPMLHGSQRAPLWDRILIRAGVLRRAGVLEGSW